MANIDIFTPHSHHDKIPVVEGIHAGFPSPAEDYTEPVLDLNRYVVRNQASTFYARITGDELLERAADNGSGITSCLLTSARYTRSHV